MKVSIQAKHSSDEGVRVIQEHLKLMPSVAGVYRMLNEDGQALYVGKAKNLKKRVVYYTKFEQLPNRLKRMVAQTKSVEFTTTYTEVEALLLENNLIKKLQPRYNILLKDDKSFPYILITEDHDFARIVKHRGGQSRPGKYFGPFPSIEAVDETIISLQRVFMIRNCTDHFFATRKRPCLQYFIKRCTAPCVGYINQQSYKDCVVQAQKFLNGQSDTVQQTLAKKMDQASQEFRYEEAAVLRDRIKLLTHIQQRQKINVGNLRDMDVIGVFDNYGQICIDVFFYRGGRNFGSHTVFISKLEDEDINTHLEAFLMQFYTEHLPPPFIMISCVLKNSDDIAKALALHHNVPLQIDVPKKGIKQEVMDYALMNAQEHLEQKLAKQASNKKIFYEMQQMFQLNLLPERIEVYDNSHIQGAFPVGVMIVATQDSFDKKSYRKFNLREQSLDFGGDDLAMMREVIKRRFKESSSTVMPDFLLIDGGNNQSQVVQKVLNELSINVPIVGIAKGEKRNDGLEQFIAADGSIVDIPFNSPIRFFLQRIRDEAHRFAIETHRHRRQKTLSKSVLDDIPGVGSVRKRQLLRHFGSAKAVMSAGVNDIQLVAGIDRATAQNIYNFFHER